MKKLLAFLMTLTLLAAAAAPAFAAGKLTISQEKVISLPYESYYKGAAYLEVRNAGDKAIQMSSGLFELMDAEGSIIGSMELETYDLWPVVLGSGETGYLTAEINVPAAAGQDIISTYSIELMGKGTVDRSVTRFPASARYETSTDENGKRNDYIVAIITNDTESTVYNFYVAFAFYDADGKLMYVTTGDWTYTGILARSSIEVYLDIPEVVTQHWIGYGTVPASAKAVAFIYSD